MERQNNKISFLLWGTLVISIGGVAGGWAPIAAQSMGDPAKAQMQEMDRREIQLNRVDEKARPADSKRSQALMDQVSEDFQRILTRQDRKSTRLNSSHRT